MSPPMIFDYMLHGGKHAGGQQPLQPSTREAANEYMTADPEHEAVPDGWHVVNVDSGRVLTDSPDSCELMDSVEGRQTLRVRSEGKTAVSLVLQGVDDLSLKAACAASAVNFIVDGMNRLERLAVEYNGSTSASAASFTVKPARLSGHSAPVLSVGGMRLDSVDMTVDSASLLLEGPKPRGLADAALFGSGAEYGSGVATVDETSSISLVDGAVLALDGSITAGSSPFRFSQQSGVAVLQDALRAVDGDGETVRMAAWSMVSNCAIGDRLTVDESSSIYRRPGPLAAWRQIPVAEAIPRTIS